MLIYECPASPVFGVTNPSVKLTPGDPGAEFQSVSGGQTGREPPHRTAVF